MLGPSGLRVGVHRLLAEPRPRKARRWKPRTALVCLWVALGHLVIQAGRMAVVTPAWQAWGATSFPPVDADRDTMLRRVPSPALLADRLRNPLPRQRGAILPGSRKPGLTGRSAGTPGASGAGNAGWSMACTGPWLAAVWGAVLSPVRILTKPMRVWCPAVAGLTSEG